jgi:hypothetical protein
VTVSGGGVQHFRPSTLCIPDAYHIRLLSQGPQPTALSAARSGAPS